LEKIEMKKTLVAVAALAAIAGAQADATISGHVEAGYLIPNSGANSFASGGNGGSEITFAGSDDLGSGMKASFAITVINNPFSLSDSGYANANPATTTENAVRTYNSFIGVSSADFGGIKLGSQFTPAFFVANTADPFGQAAGTYNLAGNTGGGSANHGHQYETITYSSPSFSGFGVNYQSNPDGSNSSYSITYSAGALNVGYGAQTNKSATNQTQTFIGANYDLGMAKIYLGTKTESNEKAATIVGLSAPVGPLVAAFSVSSKSGESQNSNFGITYPLSKRTSLAWVNYNGGDAGTRGNFVGISHNF